MIPIFFVIFPFFLEQTYLRIPVYNNVQFRFWKFNNFHNILYLKTLNSSSNYVLTLRVFRSESFVSSFPKLKGQLLLPWRFNGFNYRPTNYDLICFKYKHRLLCSFNHVGNSSLNHSINFILQIRKSPKLSIFFVFFNKEVGL